MLAIFNIILSLLLASFAFAEEPYDLERIVVKPEDSPGNISLKNNYSLQALGASEIKEKKLDSLADILNYVSGMDLRYRGALGVQADLSCRGSTYEQVAVLIDGVRVGDPQTGHHNLDLPLTVFDVEKIEVTKEGVSSLYGAGAFAGSVNFITRKPVKKVLNADMLFGGHALFGQAFSFSLPAELLSGRVSFDHKISKAARPNTDFEYKTASLYLERDFGRLAADTLFGYQKKDFGADSFYSNLFPEEEEHTETLFAKAGLEPRLGSGSWKNQLSYRKHRDKFILRRNNPASVNYHTTSVSGLDSQLSLPAKCGDFLLGLDFGRDAISSTNLGKHSRIYEAGSFGFIPALGERFSADLRLRLDHYQKWGEQESYNFGLGYLLLPESLRIKGSLSRSFRIPSFTELYYSDAANKGNSGLEPEEAVNFKLGLDFKGRAVRIGLDGFLRRGRNLIDWTRASQAEPWQATNLGQVDFKGLEFNSALSPGLVFKGVNLTKAVFSYNYTQADKKAAGFFSKYALDILKHQCLMEVYSSFRGLDFNWELSYSQRYYGETYFVGNLYIAKKITGRSFTLEPFLKIDNFTNTEYSEISGVIQPGRWFKSGLKFEW